MTSPVHCDNGPLLYEASGPPDAGGLLAPGVAASASFAGGDDENLTVFVEFIGCGVEVWRPRELQRGLGARDLSDGSFSILKGM